MDFIKVIITSAVSLAALFFSSKIIGNKQMSQLTMFDYINGITIGSIAAETATELERPILGFVAIGVYTILIFLFDFLSRKSVKLGRFLTGKSVILLDNGKIYADNFKKAKLDIPEFLCQCHTKGFFKLSDIETAIFEQNGQISFMPKAESRPVTPADLNIAPPADKPDILIISDGLVLDENLKRSGNNEEWLKKQLKNQGIKHPDEVFIASCTCDNTLTLFKKHQKAPGNDISQ